MTIRAVGAVMVMLSAVLIGTHLTGRLSDRVRVLMSVREFLLYVRRQIGYDMPPLSELFDEFGSDEAGGFFRETALLLKDGGSVEGSVRQSMRQTDIMSTLESRERELIIRILLQLGTSDCDSQINLIDGYVGDMDYCIENAAADKKQKSKIYLAVSVYSGAALAILML